MNESDNRKLARALGADDRGGILATVNAEQRLIIRELVEHILRDVREVDITDVWEQDHLASTYWILFMSGVDQEDEVALARELLFWSALFARHSARVTCIQSSDRALFKYCTTYFDLKAWPTLVFSDRPDMADFVSIDGHLLALLSERRGGVRRLLTELHALVETGATINHIATTIASEKFWKHLKMVYSEAKSFVSVSITSDVIDRGVKSRS